MRILIAEPDPSLAKRLAQSLHGIQIGPDAPELPVFVDLEPDVFAAARRGGPALLLVGLAPGARPPALAGAAPVPGSALIVLSADPAPQTRADWLLAGADDCLSKPLSMVELRARCMVALRRLHSAGASALPASALAFGALSIDRLRREASVDAQPLALTGRELLILEQLALADGELVSRSALLRAVWQGGAGATNALDVHLAALRRKLRACPGAPAVETVRGIGFQLRECGIAGLPLGALGQPVRCPAPAARALPLERLA